MEGGEPDLWRGSESRAKEMALFAGDDVVLVLQLRARKEACDALASFAVSQQIIIMRAWMRACGLCHRGVPVHSMQQQSNTALRSSAQGGRDFDAAEEPRAQKRWVRSYLYHCFLHRTHTRCTLSCRRSSGQGAVGKQRTR